MPVPPVGRRRSHGTTAGFTLVELLVAIAVLSLLSTLLFGGLRFGTRAWERAEAHAGQAGEVQLAQAFLRQRFSQAAPLPRRDGDRVTTVLFDGSSTALRLVTVMPVHLETGGYANLELGFERHTGRLMLRWRPFDFSAGASPAQADEVRILLDRVDEASFAYFGPVSDDGNSASEWQPEWRDRARLPALLRLRLRFADAGRGHWPELVVAPLASGAAPRPQ
jgi:general secretion pathway protein J